MKAIVTVIDDNGRVIEKDKVIPPYNEAISGEEIPTKTTYFRFGITELYERQKRDIDCKWADREEVDNE